MPIWTLWSNDAGDNKNVKKTIGLIRKTTTSHVHHIFLYISFPFLHEYDVEMPNFTFYGERKQATTKFYFSFWAWTWSLEIQLQEGSPTSSWQSKWLGIIATKTERTQIHFLRTFLSPSRRWILKSLINDAWTSSIERPRAAILAIPPSSVH